MSRILILCLLGLCLACKPKTLPTQAKTQPPYTAEQQDSSFHEYRAREMPVNWRTYQKTAIPEHRLHMEMIRQIEGTERFRLGDCRSDHPADRSMMDYLLRKGDIRAEDTMYITNRWALHRLRIVESDKNHLLIKDTLQDGTPISMLAMFQTFDSTGHKISRDPIGRWITHVDGRKAFGITYGFQPGQTPCFRSLEITLGDKPLKIPADALSPYFYIHPGLAGYQTFMHHPVLYESFDSQHLYLYIAGGGAAECYLAKLVFDRKGYRLHIVAEYGALTCFHALGGFHPGF